MSFIEWRNQFDFTKDEIGLLNIPREDSFVRDSNNYWSDYFFDILRENQFRINRNSKLYTSDCATDLINQLFDKYTQDNDTLIVTTGYEHPNVNKILLTKKNVIYINIFNIDYCFMLQKSNEFKKIFILLINIAEVL